MVSDYEKKMFCIKKMVSEHNLNKDTELHIIKDLIIIHLFTVNASLTKKTNPEEINMSLYEYKQTTMMASEVHDYLHDKGDFSHATH